VFDASCSFFLSSFLSFLSLPIPSPSIDVTCIIIIIIDISSSGFKIVIITINSLPSCLLPFPSRPTFLFFRTQTRYLAVNMTKVPPQPASSYVGHFGFKVGPHRVVCDQSILRGRTSTAVRDHMHGWAGPGGRHELCRERSAGSFASCQLPPLYSSQPRSLPKLPKLPTSFSISFFNLNLQPLCMATSDLSPPVADGSPRTSSLLPPPRRRFPLILQGRMGEKVGSGCFCLVWRWKGELSTRLKGNVEGFGWYADLRRGR
jgi:hypothetical protein